MITELSRGTGDAAFTLCLNPLAARDRPWTAEQDAILSDTGLAQARETICAWPGYAETTMHTLPALLTGVVPLRPEVAFAMCVPLPGV